ncbi:MAG: sugar ABC transporter substrate-binding protein [Caldilineaceae bacterium]
MKLRLLSLLLLAILLAGCIRPEGGAAIGGSDTQSQSFSFMVSGDTVEKAVYDELVAAFSKAHPEIKAEIVYIPDAGDYRKRLSADIAAGIPAEIVLLNYRRIAAYAAKDSFEPLDAYWAASETIHKEDFYPQVVDAFRWQGAQMCIPQNISSPVVYYNKKIFDDAGVAYPAAGWTWDDFVATAQAVTKDGDGDGKTDIYGVGTEASILRVAPFVWMNGGTLFDNDAEPTKLALDTPEAKTALQWFVDLQTKYQVAPDAVNEEAESSESRFLNGRLAMFLDSRRVVPTFRTISDFDWDVAALPLGKQAASVLHSDGFCITKASQGKEAAWKFIEFATSSEGQIILAKTGRTVPSLKSVAESPAYLEPGAKPANSQVWLDAIPAIRPLPILANWPDIESTLNNEIAQAFTGGQSVDSAVENAQSKVQEFLNSDD